MNTCSPRCADPCRKVGRTATDTRAGALRASHDRERQWRSVERSSGAQHLAAPWSPVVPLTTQTDPRSDVLPGYWMDPANAGALEARERAREFLMEPPSRRLPAADRSRTGPLGSRRRERDAPRPELPRGSGFDACMRLVGGPPIELLARNERVVIDDVLRHEPPHRRDRIERVQVEPLVPELFPKRLDRSVRLDASTTGRGLSFREASPVAGQRDADLARISAGCAPRRAVCARGPDRSTSVAAAAEARRCARSG